MFRYNILRSPGQNSGGGSSSTSTSTSTNPAEKNLTTTYISNPSGASGGSNISIHGGKGNQHQPIGPDRGTGVNNVSTYVPTTFIETCQPVYVQEKHLSVIRKGPTSPPTLEMFAYTRKDSRGALGKGLDLDNPDGIVDIEAEFSGEDMSFFHRDGTWVSNFYNENKERKVTGDIVSIPLDTVVDPEDFKEGDIITITHEFTDYLGISQKASVRAVILKFHAPELQDPNIPFANPYLDPLTHEWTFSSGPRNELVSCLVELLTNAIGFPMVTDIDDMYSVTLVQEDPMFKLKFPRFSYRYKYEDGEYSIFAPWSQVAFIPGEFDYFPKKGYNLGMVNNLRSLKVLDWVPKSIPKDVLQVDLLYKESNSPNVYTVESFKKDDDVVGTGGPSGENYWNTPGTGKNFGKYTINSELIHATIPSNQMLRPWDNVPRKALAQDITANRLIFANYLQNYDVKSDGSSNEIKPIFNVSVKNMTLDTPSPKLPAKSLKSMRSYQLGIVYRDRYGRETPVLTSKTGLFKIKKDRAPFYNRIQVGMTSDAPDWAESFTYYIKETSNEYYNAAMDRWYDAEDGGVWVSFPSSERNKIKEDGVLILKKQHETDIAVITDEEYKVIDIKNSAPTFVKTDTQYWGSAPMMLPPPGWGGSGKPGGWQSGMFAPSGIPGLNRIYLDIYKEYMDASILGGIKSHLRDGVEIRITQSPNQASGLAASVNTLTNKSDWYKVGALTQTTEDPETYIEQVQDPSDPSVYIETEVEVPGTTHPIMRMTLEKRMGEDMRFTEPPHNLDLSRGLSMEVRTYKVRDKAQFEGRFFVKLFKSNDFVTNIVKPSQKTSDSVIVLQSKGVKYICDAHPGIQDWSFMKPIEHGISGAPSSPTALVDEKLTNYIPPGVNLTMHPDAHPTIYPDPIGDLTDGTMMHGREAYRKWKNNPARNPYSVVSSYGSHAIAATYRTMGGTLGGAPDGANDSGSLLGANETWPYGPGPLDNSTTTGDWLDPLAFVDASGSPLPNVDPAQYGDPQAPTPGQDFYFQGLQGTRGWGNGTFWSQKYKYHVDSQGYPFFFSPNQTLQDWPSFFPSSWEPRWIPLRSNISNYKNDSTPPLLNDDAPWFALPPYYTNIAAGFPGTQIVESLTSTMVFTSTTSTGSAAADAYASLSNFNGDNSVNPYLMPAIWGDDRAMLRGDGINTGVDTPNPTFEWSPSTIGYLNRDWMGYWDTGTGANDTEWPYMRVDWDRWFIDKVGAAEGYGGHGIYNQQGVSHMSISYWGIGKDDNVIRPSHDLGLENAGEVAFGNAMATVGTMFRFKQDPDQTIYTITQANVEKIWNYEGFKGSWGCLEDPAVPTTVTIGGGHFKEVLPNSGSVMCGKGGRRLGGERAYFSDLFNDISIMPYQGHWRNTGRHMTNFRLRINVVLDKEIGGGENGFHPITNHVDADGKANVEQAGASGARVRYDSNAAGHVTTEKGGTPPYDYVADPDNEDQRKGYKMYNLASYWNVNDAGRTLIDGETKHQPDSLDHDFYTEVDGNDKFVNWDEAAFPSGPYIGLHERGLNQTTIEVLEYYSEEDNDKTMSNNPAVFETEPREDIGLDIYYAASPSYPVNVKRFRYDTDEEQGWSNFNLRGEEYIKVGSEATINDGNVNLTSIVDGVQENMIWLNSHIKESLPPSSPPPPGWTPTPLQLAVGDEIKFTMSGEGSYYGAGVDTETFTAVVESVVSLLIFTIKINTHTTSFPRSLGYFNCYSFGNGVESNRVRDDYNAVTIDKGVKASMPLATPYEEERKGSSLIFSGIYNSTSGVNDTNQFIQAEPITKDLNPINGSIQKIFARDTDLVTFCENKVFKILAKKDALFNADGNTNVTSNAAVLGQSIPFSGEYGMSRNPESFAAESYRVYFTDKDRGTVMRLSKDGLTPISDKGMKDWFKDNLMRAETLIGSFDTREDHYNLSIDTKDQDVVTNAYTLSFTEEKGGSWISFKSFIQQDGISYKNKYYTFPSNKFNSLPTDVGSDSKRLYGDVYGEGIGMGEMWQHHIDLDFHRTTASAVNGGNVISLSNASVGTTAVIVEGMNVEGNGVPVDTVVAQAIGGNITLGKYDETGNIILVNVYVDANEELRFTTARNNFYQTQSHSMVRTLFNGAQGSVKRFKTINYEGTQGKTLEDSTTDFYQLSQGITTINVGQIYGNNMAKEGWEVSEIKTDLQDGSIAEFIAKENKWFNYIRGFEDAGAGDSFDAAEFSAQGLGFTNL